MVGGMRRELFFLLKFFLIYFLLQAVIQFASPPALEVFVAGFEASLLGLQSSDNEIFTPVGVFVINAACTGLVSASILAAIVFSLKRPGLKVKAIVFVVGALGLFLLNLARVFFVLFVALNAGANAAEAVHVLSWFSTAGFVLVLWYAATKAIAGVKNFSELM